MNIAYNGYREIIEGIEIIDTISVGVSDSFVMYNKFDWTDGNGESRLYIGSKEDVAPFFELDFIQQDKPYKAFVTKNDLLYYLITAEAEYHMPQSTYRNQDSLEDCYQKYEKTINDMDDFEMFLIKPHNGRRDSRFYIGGYDIETSNNQAEFYKFLRKLCFPQISRISIVKVKDIRTQEIMYWFRPFIHEYSILKIPVMIEAEEMKINENENLNQKQKYTLIISRLGQGKYREECLKRYEGKCVITNIDQQEVLEACHIKPWIDCDNIERVDAKNSILLIPTIHKLLDLGFVTFDNNYEIICSAFVTSKMKSFIDKNNSKTDYRLILEKSEEYIKYHREKIYRD